jgi:hypothetical protein
MRVHKHWGIGGDLYSWRSSSSSSPVDVRIPQLKTMIRRAAAEVSHIPHIVESLFSYCAARPSVLANEVPSLLLSPCMLNYQWRPRLATLAESVDVLHVAMRHGAHWNDDVDGCSRCVWYRGSNNRSLMMNLVSTCAAPLLIPSEGIDYHHSGNGMPLLDFWPMRTPYMQQAKQVISHCMTLQETCCSYLLSPSHSILPLIITDHNVISLIAEYMQRPRFIFECKKCGKCFDRIKSQSYGAAQIGNADQFW